MVFVRVVCIFCVNCEQRLLVVCGLCEPYVSNYVSGMCVLCGTALQSTVCESLFGRVMFGLYVSG